MPRSRSKLFPTPDDAETAFYDAFERADVAAMMAVWAESDDIVCIHPQGPRLAGFEAVRESWAQIFAGGAQLRVRTTEERRFDGQTLAVHNVIELVAAPGGESEPTHVMASNVFDSLLEYDYLARPVKLKPRAAAALPEVNADGTVYTLRVKPGIYFTTDPAFKGKRRELVAQDF